MSAAPETSDLPLPTGSTRATSERRGSYMVQLDGLRAAAVCLVMVNHFDLRTGPYMLGPFAVRVFFVLSGFLITGILLKVRRDARPGETWLGLRRFYVRRFLRIFPLYYVALAVLLACNAYDIRERWGWDALYLTNMYIPIYGAGKVVEGHFWSLAVEEQFYVFWPWVILFCKREWLVKVVVAVAIAGPTYRLAALLGGANFYWIWMPLPASFDSLGLGALLAIASSGDWNLEHWRERLCRAGLYAGLPILLAILALSIAGRINFATSVVFESSAALVGVWLVGRAAAGFGGFVGNCLAWTPVAYVGLISYGIYVWHNLFHWYFMPIGMDAVGLPPQRFYVRFAIYVLGSLLIATTSWFVMERPINALKRFYPYRDPPGPKTVPPRLVSSSAP